MKINGIILRTRDVDQLTEFWGTKVGFEVTQRLDGYSFLDGGGITLTIAAVDRAIHDESWTEIVVSSDDVETDFTVMQGRGVPFESALGSPIMIRDGRDLVAAHFQDPDGHYGRLTGWVDSP